MADSPQGWGSHNGPASEKYTSEINNSEVAMSLLTLKFSWEIEGICLFSKQVPEKVGVRGPVDTDFRMKALKLISHRETQIQVTGKCHPRYSSGWLETTV